MPYFNYQGEDMKMLDARAKEDSPKRNAPKVDKKKGEKMVDAKKEMVNPKKTAMVDTKNDEEMVDKKKDEKMVDAKKAMVNEKKEAMVDTKTVEMVKKEEDVPVRAVENPQLFNLKAKAQIRPKKRPR